MKAITLYPEWAWAICNLDKRVENRGWPLPKEMAGQMVALHAGKYIGGRPGVPAKIEGTESVCRMARFAGWFYHGTVRSCEMVRIKDATTVHWKIEDVPVSSIVAFIRFGPAVPPDAGDLPKWRVPDCYGWPIVEVMRLKEPVPCKGALGFWELPTAILQRCQEVGTVEDEQLKLFGVHSGLPVSGSNNG